MITGGLLSGITGKGGHLVIVDDPNQEPRAGPLNHNPGRKSTPSGAASILSRQEPGAVFVVMATRWHQDDFDQPDPLRGEDEQQLACAISLPALAEDLDPLNRQPGEALWPARFDEVALAQIKAAVGSYVWGALYQQHPSPAEGGIIGPGSGSTGNCPPSTTGRSPGTADATRTGPTRSATTWRPPELGATSSTASTTGWGSRRPSTRSGSCPGAGPRRRPVHRGQGKRACGDSDARRGAARADRRRAGGRENRPLLRCQPAVRSRQRFVPRPLIAPWVGDMVKSVVAPELAGGRRRRCHDPGPQPDEAGRPPGDVGMPYANRMSFGRRRS